MAEIRQIKSKTKCDLVVEEMLSMIIKGEYKEGQRLPPENVFIESFGVSRITVREAFKKLNTIGVITIRQGEGTFVNKANMGTLMKPLYSMVAFDKITINQIYDARLYIEAGNASLAAINRSTEDLAKLKAWVEKMHFAVAEHDEDGFTNLDSIFHTSIAEISRNDILLGAYSIIKSILVSYIKRTNYSRETIKTSLDCHIKIVDFIEAQNAEEAGKAMKMHIETSKQSLLAQLNEEI
jgi:Transcriptional regulators